MKRDQLHKPGRVGGDAGAYNLVGQAANAMERAGLLGWLRNGSRLAFWLLLLLTLCALALAMGIKPREYVFNGPFAAETNPPERSLFVYSPTEGPAQWWRQPVLGDIPAKPKQSILQLQINGREIGPPHSQHLEIRKGMTAGFSHWGPIVLFSLPPGVTNGPETVAKLYYSVRPRHWVTVTLVAITGLLGYFVYGGRITSCLKWLQLSISASMLRAARPLAFVLRLPGFALLAFGCAVLAASIAYILATLYAAATGWALPTTAPLRWSAFAQWFVRNEPSAGYVLLTLAGLGTIASWLARLNPDCERAVKREELRLSRFLFRFGIVIIGFGFLLCISAMWAGIARVGDLHYGNIGGLLPFSDAANYYSAAHDQTKDGVWNIIAARRPWAAAFRSVLLVFANFSLPIMLILQICLLACATWFASAAVARWRGIWAATAFVALLYIYTRPFVTTTYTESLGLFWALLSVPFFIEAIVGGSARPALVAFALTAVALMIRTGSMFTLPALLIWLIWQFGKGIKAKLAILAAATCILIVVFGTNALLQYMYGTPQASSSGNFAYVLCGLTMGTNWDGCIPKLAAMGKTLGAGEAAYVRDLYAMAAENFRSAPEVFFTRLGDSAGEFASHFPEVLWKGYGTSLVEPGWLFRNALTAISLAGLIFVLARRSKAIELAFWAVVWLSVTMSAAIIYFDGGQRALAASVPLIALFFAIGFSSPSLQHGWTRSSHPLWPRYGSIGLIVTTVLFISVPWLAYRLSPARAMSGYSLPPKPDEVVVLGGRRMSGFLVVEDGAPLRNDIPTLHLSDFEAIVRQSTVESYQDLVHPVVPPLPFGFIFAPRLEKRYGSGIHYIVPANVVERPDVPSWRFKVKEWGRKHIGTSYWFYVTDAEPLHE